MSALRFIPEQPSEDMLASAAKALQDCLTRPEYQGLLAHDEKSSELCAEIARQMIVSAFATAPVVAQEPDAWLVSHPRFCGETTLHKETAEHWESHQKGSTTEGKPFSADCKRQYWSICRLDPCGRKNPNLFRKQ